MNWRPYVKTIPSEKVCEAEGAYSVADVISETDTGGAGTPWLFPGVVKFNGANGYIVSARVMSETTALTARLTLYLFTVAPTSELDDNATNTAVLWANRANYITKIDFPALEELGTGSSEAVSTPSTVGNLAKAFTCDSNDNALYGILVTRDAFDQVDDKSIRIDLDIEQY